MIRKVSLRAALVANVLSVAVGAGVAFAATGPTSAVPVCSHPGVTTGSVFDDTHRIHP